MARAGPSPPVTRPTCRASPLSWQSGEALSDYLILPQVGGCKDHVEHALPQTIESNVYHPEMYVCFWPEISEAIPSSQFAGPPAEREDSCPTIIPSTTPPNPRTEPLRP